MEKAGFDTIWLTEHHFSKDGYLPSLAAMTAALAMVTEKVTIGHSIIELPLHHPVALAEDIAVADILSGGRVRMGIGLGRMNFDWRSPLRTRGWCSARRTSAATGRGCSRRRSRSSSAAGRISRSPFKASSTSSRRST
jgi:alkanesulfonate monooxygenase SsuD/methylene tetrahydromethanopterin reductase-like flavin-dependent oxidoreductase (luciferase family)